MTYHIKRKNIDGIQLNFNIKFKLILTYNILFKRFGISEGYSLKPPSTILQPTKEPRTGNYYKISYIQEPQSQIST